MCPRHRHLRAAALGAGAAPERLRVLDWAGQVVCAPQSCGQLQAQPLKERGRGAAKHSEEIRWGLHAQRGIGSHALQGSPDHALPSVSAFGGAARCVARPCKEHAACAERAGGM